MMLRTNYVLLHIKVYTWSDVCLLQPRDIPTYWQPVKNPDSVGMLWLYGKTHFGFQKTRDVSLTWHSGAFVQPML